MEQQTSNKFGLLALSLWERGRLLFDVGSLQGIGSERVTRATL